MIRSACVLFVGLWVAQPAAAQSPNGSAPNATDTKSESNWSILASAAAYFFPDQPNYLQPTITADRGEVHLEARYNYEDRQSTSAFVGWNLGFGETVKVELTPMVGGLFGSTVGVVPAFELDLVWRRIEASVEGELVLDVQDAHNSFVYNWSELAVWATDWLRAGIVTQRTRVYQTARELEVGVLAGTSLSRFEGTVYFFNPGASDRFVVVALGVRF